MKAFALFPKIYLYRPAVDMRKQLNGLSTLVAQAMSMDPFADSLYVFCNQRRDLLKCIYWDKTGFAMWVKKLDAEKFRWPRKLSDEVIHLSSQQMSFLLDGYDILQMKKHKNLDYQKFI